MMVNSVRASVAGRDLVIETGLLASQADGAVTIKYGESVVLVTACVSREPREGVDFLPLTVDYEERLYAAGKIPGGFIRREGRPSEDAILASRLTDRPLRPLFPKGFRNDVQVIITVLSADQVNDPDILALVGASAALTISSIPFAGPVGAVRMGYMNGRLVVNPTLVELMDSDLDLVVASTRDAIVMVEAGSREVSRELLVEAIKVGHEANQDIIRIQEELRKVCGKPKLDFQPPEVKPGIAAACSAIVERLNQALTSGNKSDREKMVNALQQEIVAQLGGDYPEGEIASAFDAQLKKCVRDRILQFNQHIDGRRFDEIRPISCQVGLLPRTHGSGLFSRGQTQVLTITTLGSKGEQQMLDGLGIEETKRFMHHYNFPPFSTGEVKRVGSPGRREIGHGALVERAVSKVLPKEEEFPYTIRLVSEVLSSNGSTSMASVCGSSLSLMDAGVPIKAPVAGIAMGLVMGDDGRRVILTDIEGMEDACGDMDFKIAGTAKGITALQLDIKRPGLSWDILAEALGQGCKGYLFVLDRIKETISTSRPETSRYAPRIYQITIPTEKIGTVIGPGGKTIRSIIEKTKVTIDVGDDGKVQIGSTSEDAAQAAIRMIEDLTREVAVGAVYTGKVTRILNFGAMVEILPGKEGLVHISELAPYRVNAVEDVVKVGDEIMVKVVEIDRMGRVNLSRRAVFDEQAKGPVAGGRAAAVSSRGADRPDKRRPGPPPPRPSGGTGRRRN